MSAVADFLDRHTEHCLLTLCGHGPHAVGLVHGDGFNVPIPDPTQYGAIQAFCQEYGALVYRPVPGQPVVLRCGDEDAAMLARLLL